MLILLIYFSLVSKANFGYSGNLMYILQTNGGMSEQRDEKKMDGWVGEWWTNVWVDG